MAGERLVRLHSTRGICAKCKRNRAIAWSLRGARSIKLFCSIECLPKARQQEAIFYTAGKV